MDYGRMLFEGTPDQVQRHPAVIAAYLGTDRMSALIEIAGLELAYGDAPVCRELCLEVRPGEIVALIGANGAGKTTTLRAVAGALLPRAGAIRFQGKDVTRLPAHERSRLGIALVPEGRRVFPFPTVRENLELGGFNFRRDKARLRALMDRSSPGLPSGRHSLPAR
jgi:branched-chain amino acid transport system ATP-binding protein